MAGGSPPSPSSSATTESGFAAEETLELSSPTTRAGANVSDRMIGEARHLFDDRT